MTRDPKSRSYLENNGAHSISSDPVWVSESIPLLYPVTRSPDEHMPACSCEDAGTESKSVQVSQTVQRRSRARGGDQSITQRTTTVSDDHGRHKRDHRVHYNFSLLHRWCFRRSSSRLSRSRQTASKIGLQNGQDHVRMAGKLNFEK